MRGPLVLLAVLTVTGVDASRLSQSAQDRAPVFSSSAELVVLHVTVTEPRGAYVTDLPRDAFRILEDGVAQRIDFFTGEDSPVTVGLLIDSSASMRESRERVIAAATAFAEASDSEDEIFGLAFNEHVRAVLPPSTPFTSDPAAFRKSASRSPTLRGNHESPAPGMDIEAGPCTGGNVHGPNTDGLVPALD